MIGLPGIQESDFWSNLHWILIHYLLFKPVNRAMETQWSITHTETNAFRSSSLLLALSVHILCSALHGHNITESETLQHMTVFPEVLILSRVPHTLFYFSLTFRQWLKKIFFFINVYCQKNSKLKLELCLCEGVYLCGTYQSALRSDEWSVLAVHLVIESTCITEIMTCSISPPQRSWCSSTVHTFTPFRHTLCTKEMHKMRREEIKKHKQLFHADIIYHM